MIKVEHELATWMFAAKLCLIEDGYSPEDILSEAGLDLSRLSSSTEQLPKKLVENTWDAIEMATGNDAYGLRTLPFVSDPFLNALLTSIKACGSIQNALQLLFKYSKVVHPGISFSAAISESLELEVSSKNSATKMTKRDIDFTFGIFSKICREILPLELKPLNIQVRRKAPANSEEYLSHFDCPVEFSASRDAISLPLNFLNGEIPGADPILAEQLERYLSDQTQALDDTGANETIEAIVMSILDGLLCEGTPKLSDVADQMGISSRSLQRHLREQSLSFSSLLKSARLNAAKRILSKHYSDCLDEVAHAAGFSETSNFVRFFKQQTGQTPLSYVRQITLS